MNGSIVLAKSPHRRRCPLRTVPAERDTAPLPPLDWTAHNQYPQTFLKDVFRTMMYSCRSPLKRFALQVLAAVAGATLVLLGPGCGRSADHPAAVSPPQETALEYAEKRVKPIYMCPMHPQVVQSEPGRCPICGMDLVVKKAAVATPDRHGHAAVKDTPAVIVSAAVVNQLGVRTAEVRRGTLTRHIEGLGVFLRSTARGYRPVYKDPEASANDTGISASALLVQAQVFEREALLLREGQTARVRFPSLGARK